MENKKQLPSHLSDMENCHFLNIRVNPHTISTLMRTVSNAIKRQRRFIIANHNLHSLALIRRHPLMEQFYRQADTVHIDGMALVVIGRALGCRLYRTNRITYVDWLPHLMKAASINQWRICYIGSKPGLGERAITELKKQYGDLNIVVHHGYFNIASQSENKKILNFVNNFNPSILMVGMGMPRQEEWILKNMNALPNTVILPCGAALDYVAGVVPTPPRWTGKIGAEWLFRMLAEPGRMWQRYLIEPWSIALPFIREFLKKHIST